MFILLIWKSLITKSAPESFPTSPRIVSGKSTFNLAKVTIKDNVCISQGCLLLCGNHNYKKTSFDLITGEITFEEGSWAGAKTVICPGVRLGKNSLLTVGSIATSSLEENWIYQGNPAKKLKLRVLKN